MGRHMTQALNPTFLGEFSSAYDSYKKITVADLAPMTQYEYIQALQLVDLNWAILQLKASAQVELATGTEKTVRQLLTRKLEGDGERDFNCQLRAFTDAGGDEDDFEDPVNWEAIDLRIETLMSDLKSKEPVKREQATAEAISLGFDPRIVLSRQFLENSNYNWHERALPELEKRVRL